MKQFELGVLGLSLLLFVVSPYIPNTVLNATVGTSLGILVLLLAPLLVVRYNPVLALAVLLAVGALFLENRKRILTGIKISINTDIKKGGTKYAPVDAVVEGASDLIDGEVHPEHETPFEESHNFHPEKNTTDGFENVGESINEKGALETVPTNSSRTMADHFEKAGLA